MKAFDRNKVSVKNREVSDPEAQANRLLQLVGRLRASTMRYIHSSPPSLPSFPFLTGYLTFYLLVPLLQIFVLAYIFHNIYSVPITTLKHTTVSTLKLMVIRMTDFPCSFFFMICSYASFFTHLYQIVGWCLSAPSPSSPFGDIINSKILCRQTGSYFLRFIWVS